MGIVFQTSIYPLALQLFELFAQQLHLRVDQARLLCATECSIILTVAAVAVVPVTLFINERINFYRYH